MPPSARLYCLINFGFTRKLAGSKIGVNEYFCLEVRNTKGRLIPYSKHAKIREYTAFLKKDKLALNGINRGKDIFTGQRLECNEETDQQDSEPGERSNLEEQIQRRSYTCYRGLWKKVNGVERRVQLGTGGGGGGGGSSSSSSTIITTTTTTTTNSNKNNIHHSQKKYFTKQGSLCRDDIRDKGK